MPVNDENILISKIQTKNEEAIFESSVGEFIWKKLGQLNDESVCLIEARTGKELNIGELRRQANSIAVALIERAITKTDRIAFYGRNSIQHSVLRFVAYFLGITFMPLSPTFEKYEVEQEVNSAGANIVFSSAKDLHKFDNVLNDKRNNNKSNVKLVVVFDGNDDKYLTFEQLLEEGRDQTLDRIPHFVVNQEKDMLFLIHTSGSTGRPKCAMIPHPTFIRVFMESTAFTEDKNKSKTKVRAITGLIFPFGHMSGTITLPLSIISGTKLILFDDFDEELMFKSIEKYRISVLPVFPNIGVRFIDSDLVDKYDLSSLKLITTGGAAFPVKHAQAIIDKYGVMFKNAYGMTEALFVTFGSDPMDPVIAGNAGLLAPGTELKIIDLSTGKNLGPNSDGEICIRGNKLFAGYLNDEKATKEAIDEDGWYRTGDIGHYDEKERLFITDRLKEVIRIGVDNHYINISPVEIELFLISHKSIAEVAVIGVNNRSGTHWPRAYVVPKDGHKVNEQEIQKYVSDTLAYTKHLKGGVVFVDKIQRTSIGKVNRKYYRNLVKDEIID